MCATEHLLKYMETGVEKTDSTMPESAKIFLLAIEGIVAEIEEIERGAG